MRTCSGLLVCLLLLPALASGQSLGATAEKERERREKLRQSGATSRTVTDEDLAANKGQLANDPGSSSNTGDKASPPAVASPAAAEGGGEKAAEGFGERAEGGGERAEGGGEGSGAKAAEANGEAYWRGRARDARIRIDHAQFAVSEAQRRLRAPGMMMENGQPVVYSLAQLKQRADAADAELAAAQKALEDLTEEARRARALPGWLR